jgi:hypothetical protein
MTLNISVSQHSRDPQPFPDVHHVQSVLKAKGLYPYTVDGIYGDRSRAGVVKFQTLEGLTRDGIVGPQTLAALDRSVPTRPAVTQAAKMADLALRLVTTGIDGTRPSYVFGAEVSMRDPSPDRLDCSELVQWAVTQVDGATWVDGSAYQYGACKHVSVDTAIKTKGALLFISSNGRQSGIHHVAISLGNGKTAEARSRYMTPSCGSWSVTGRGFNLAGLVPVLAY